MTENLIGWSGYEWVTPVRCQVCSNLINRGIIKVADRGKELDPNFRAVCWPCFYNFPKYPEAMNVTQKP